MDKQIEIDFQELKKQQPENLASRELNSQELLADKISFMRIDVAQLESLLRVLPRELPHQADKALKSLLLK